MARLRRRLVPSWWTRKIWIFLLIGLLLNPYAVSWARWRTFYVGTTGGTGSMLPYVQKGDWFLWRGTLAGARDLERGDVVASAHFMKRVIGLPNETVEISGGAVFIDGRPLAEPYVRHELEEWMAPVTLGSDEFFIMGDNRAGSFDSRDYGPVARSTISSQVVTRTWPPSRASWPAMFAHFTLGWGFGPLASLGAALAGLALVRRRHRPLAWGLLPYFGWGLGVLVLYLAVSPARGRTATQSVRSVAFEYGFLLAATFGVSLSMLGDYTGALALTLGTVLMPAVVRWFAARLRGSAPPSPASWHALLAERALWLGFLVTVADPSGLLPVAFVVVAATGLILRERLTTGGAGLSLNLALLAAFEAAVCLGAPWPALTIVCMWLAMLLLLRRQTAVPRPGALEDQAPVFPPGPSGDAILSHEYTLTPLQQLQVGGPSGPKPLTWLFRGVVALIFAGAGVAVLETAADSRVLSLLTVAFGLAMIVFGSLVLLAATKAGAYISLALGDSRPPRHIRLSALEAGLQLVEATGERLIRWTVITAIDEVGRDVVIRTHWISDVFVPGGSFALDEERRAFARQLRDLLASGARANIELDGIDGEGVLSVAWEPDRREHEEYVRFESGRKAPATFLKLLLGALMLATIVQWRPELSSRALLVDPVIVALCLLGLFKASLDRWLVLRQLRARFEDPATSERLFAPTALTLRQESILDVSGGGRITTRWEDVREVAITGAGVYLYTLPGIVLMAPARAFPSEEAYREFAETARQRWQAARKPAAA